MSKATTTGEHEPMKERKKKHVLMSSLNQPIYLIYTIPCTRYKSISRKWCMPKTPTCKELSLFSTKAPQGDGHLGTEGLPWPAQEQHHQRLQFLPLLYLGCTWGLYHILEPVITKIIISFVYISSRDFSSD